MQRQEHLSQIFDLPEKLTSGGLEFHSGQLLHAKERSGQTPIPASTVGWLTLNERRHPRLADVCVIFTDNRNEIAMSLNLELTSLAPLAAHEAPGTYLPLCTSPELGLQARTATFDFLGGCWGLELHYLCTGSTLLTELYSQPLTSQCGGVAGLCCG